ncbi:hypothetical protein MMC20_007726 [Loxospora ochrophaea]|nr:hypothetical protein [Loxospora ochrophaea]
MHRQLYAKGAGHVSEVAKTLNQLFHDPSVSSVLTPQAFCIAIAFFTRHCMISAVRNLIVRMNELSVKAEPEIFDLMLMGAASQRDLHNFTFLLKEMIRQGMVPTADTWSALTLAVDSEAAKLVIIRKMQQRKLITKLPTIRFVVSQLITMEVLSHIRSGRILVSFLNSMDLKYGEHWLSVGAGNKIIDTLCAHGMLSEAIEMLYLMKDRGQNPNQGSLIILLSQYARLRDEEGVLSVLRLFQFEFSLRPSQDAYDVMFITAWRHRSFNCCKTIWKYACVKSAVSHRMQRLVFTTLVRNTPEKPKTKTLKWYKTAGKVIIGIGLQADGRREALSGKNLWDQLGTWSETGNTRSESLITASGLLALELEASITFRPKLDFLELFEEALTMDRIWTKENTLMEKHVKWMVSNAVRIDFRPRR